MPDNRSAGQRTQTIISLAVLALSLAGLAACGGGGVTSVSPVTNGSTSAGTSTTVATGSGGGSTSTSGTSSTGSGGGATVTASPYILFSSSYIAYATQTNGAFLHSAQNGNVYAGFGGNLGDGGYSSAQDAINRTGLYVFQTKASTSVAATTAADYAYVAVLAPAGSTVDISQAATLLIQMGNTVNQAANGGNANVFTVDINNTAGSTAATGDCSTDQTLTAVGNNVTKTALGARTYAIPLSAFTCTVGTLATLQSAGITTVAVKIVGNKNPNIASGEIDTIAIGMIGFTGTMTSADITTINTL